MIGTHPTLVALILTVSVCSVPAGTSLEENALRRHYKQSLSLWYRRPARQWVEALALGSGRLGAMVFGVVAGIGEMLQQSCAGEIELLPVLPKAGPNGSVKGLCARGGFELDTRIPAVKKNVMMLTGAIMPILTPGLDRDGTSCKDYAHGHDKTLSHP